MDELSLNNTVERIVSNEHPPGLPVFENVNLAGEALVLLATESILVKSGPEIFNAFSVLRDDKPIEIIVNNTAYYTKTSALQYYTRAVSSKTNIAKDDEII